ncbi:hypothetical protein [Nocardia fusca]|jgi:hypothetical protein|nr:hypothetical protein [Nocardia fusca]
MATIFARRFAYRRVLFSLVTGRQPERRRRVPVAEQTPRRRRKPE